MMNFSGHTEQWLRDWADEINGCPAKTPHDELAEHVNAALTEIALLRGALHARQGDIDAPLVANGEAPRPLDVPNDVPANRPTSGDAASAQSKPMSMTATLTFADEETEALRTLAGLTPEARARAINYLKARYGNLS